MLRSTLPFAIAVVASLAVPVRADSTAPPAAIRYRLGLLSRGPGWTPERNAHTDSIQAGHMANIGRMAALGALVAAGPFMDPGDLRGLFVFAPEATALDSMLAGDPAIANGLLQCQLATWIAPPGLGEAYRRRAAETGRAGQGLPDSMVSFGWVMLHRGPKYDSRPTPSVEKLIRQHFEYTETLRASGQLVYAGAIEGTGDLRGVLVMQGDSAHVARAVLADPAVRAKRYVPQVLRWFTAWGTIPGH
jgi:uncharacterized protein YciI